MHVGVPSAVTKLGTEPSSVACAALTTSIYCGCPSFCSTHNHTLLDLVEMSTQKIADEPQLDGQLLMHMHTLRPPDQFWLVVLLVFPITCP